MAKRLGCETQETPFYSALYEGNDEVGGSNMPTSGTGPVKEKAYLSDTCEAAPFVLRDRLMLMECVRPPGGGSTKDYYLKISDVESGSELAHFAEGYGLASILVERDGVYVYASRWEGGTWNDVTLFQSDDLCSWNTKRVLQQEGKEHIFNTTVCRVEEGYVMAYETNDPSYVPFTVKFAESSDLFTWHRIPSALFAPDRYAACPCLRYSKGWFYMLYTEHRKPEWRFETFMVRSRDLVDWQPSPRNPIIAPEEGEDINTSDPDLAEYHGRVYLYYSIGDQRTYSRLKRAVFDGSLEDFFAWAYRS